MVASVAEDAGRTVSGVRLGGSADASTASTSPSSICVTTAGVLQCVVDGARDLRSEYVVRITGTVKLRPEGTANPALATGEIEVHDCRG